MQRASGILLHPTSLPGDLPIGDLGPQAKSFIDFLASAGQSVWQILPLAPTGYGHSPYNALSAFAGNPALIDLTQLTAYGDLDKTAATELTAKNHAISFAKTLQLKGSLLESAGKNFFKNASADRIEAFTDFCESEAYWLDDYSLFMATKDYQHQRPWYEWPEDIRERHTDVIRSLSAQLHKEQKQIKYQQFIFSEQWQALKKYANQKNVKIFGDLPIFVAYDSADVWAHQRLFQLDSHGKTMAVAGVPPDYFSKTGQRWGNPLYQWDKHLSDNFSWWITRFNFQLKQCDLLRVDHFRGFQACWSIPAEEKTAIKGHWESVPGRELFTEMQRQFGELPIVAEDLGVITDDVEQLRDDFGFPGMKILQFAFDSGPDNPYLPENYKSNCVVYTGTHDNNTTLGWWQNLTKNQKALVRDYLGCKHPDMPWDLVRLATGSTADLCIIPCQDILSLGSKARLNTPGRPTGNWEWQLPANSLTDELAERLYKLTKEKNRLNLQ